MLASVRQDQFPYALRDKVDAKVSRLVEEGTLEPVQFSDWAAPIVVALKSDMLCIILEQGPMKLQH